MTAIPHHSLPAIRVTDRGRAIRRALLLAIAQAMWMAVVVNLVAPRYSDLLTADMARYLAAAKNVTAGLVPYRDFLFEYPPGALLPILAPAAWAGRSLDVTAYLWAFVAENALLAGVITLLLAAWADLRAATAFNLLLAIGAAFVPLRFDLLPALLTLLAVKWALDHPARSGAMLALGVLVKLYPAALFPMLLLPHLKARRWNDAGKFAGAFVSVLLLVLLPTYVISHGHVLDSIAFHRQRGVQIESLAGGLILLASKLHATAAVIGTSFFSSNVTSPWSASAIAVLPVLLLIGIGLQFLRDWKSSEIALAASCATALWIFIATSKVFSPQFVIWVLPLTALSRDRRWIAAASLWLLTAAMFPFRYDSLKQIDWLPVLVLNLRNAIVLSIIIYGLATRPMNKISPVSL